MIPEGVDWGTVPAWVGAVLTGLSFGYALVWEPNRRRREARRLEARKVYGHAKKTERVGDERERLHVDVVITNEADFPIRDVKVHLLDWREDKKLISDERRFDFIRHQSTAETTFNIRCPDLDPTWLRPARVRVYFNDAEGRRWERGPEGHLRRLRKRPRPTPPARRAKT